MNQPNLIRLSQIHLNLLETCPPQFQRVFIEQLSTPVPPEQQDKISWGSQFHLLMQQQELGLSLLETTAEDEQLNQSVEALKKETAYLWQHPDLWHDAEHYRTLTIDNYLLTAVYDLLILAEHQAQILDWKTYPEPEKKHKLLKNWQTRLYPYLLAETSHYLPEQISMTYWFVKLPQKPKSVTFKYDSQQHQKNHQDLQNLLNKLHQYLEEYEQNNLSFPHHPNCETSCQFASFLLKSDRDSQHYQSLLEDLETIEEIPIG